MNEPEQYQPTNTDERQETADAAPVSSSSDAAASSQPEYGQINQPEYGAMSSQLPAGYDPYVYGAPEPEPQPADATAAEYAIPNGAIPFKWAATDASVQCERTTESIRRQPVWAESV